MNYIEIYRVAPSAEIGCKQLITAYNSGSEPKITRAFENFVTSVIGSNCQRCDRLKSGRKLEYEFLLLFSGLSRWPQSL